MASSWLLWLFNFSKLGKQVVYIKLHGTFQRILLPWQVFEIFPNFFMTYKINQDFLLFWSLTQMILRIKVIKNFYNNFLWIKEFLKYLSVFKVIIFISWDVVQLYKWTMVLLFVLVRDYKFSSTWSLFLKLLNLFISFYSEYKAINSTHNSAKNWILT